VIQRFQIEDLVIQDSSGVVFRAVDTETNQTVAVRRFFPFGANGGGLREDEQIAYDIAVERLATITHPALRAVICGGCDPVDGMPYIATEWIEGPRLEAIIVRGPLDPVAAAKLLSQALEVCELLSEVLAEEAVWVETSLQAIVVGAEGTGRGVTFWIAPLKWLGKHDGQRGLESIVTLTEEIMGWTEKSVPDQAGHGLGGWLKWLRGKARTTTLHEAREMLASSIGVEPPVPVKRLVRQATRPLVVTRKKKKSRMPVVIGAAVTLVAIASGGFWLIKRQNAANAAMPLDSTPATTAAGSTATQAPPPEVRPEEPLPAANRSGPRSVAQVNREAAELLASTRDRDREKDARRLAIPKQGNVFAVGDRELLLERKNSEVQLGGRLAEVRFSGSGATLYLEFSKTAAKDEPRGYIMKKDLTTDINLESLRKFIGKNVQISGQVSTPTSLRRPEIEIKNLAAIREVQ
jgi:hypothetical protein